MTACAGLSVHGRAVRIGGEGGYGVSTFYERVCPIAFSGDSIANRYGKVGSQGSTIVPRCVTPPVMTRDAR